MVVIVDVSSNVKLPYPVSGTVNCASDRTVMDDDCPIKTSATSVDKVNIPAVTSSCPLMEV